MSEATKTTSATRPTWLAAISVGPQATVREALAAIDREGRGMALLVDAQGHLEGTISDGDIRRAILAGATLENAVAGFARRDFVFVGPDADRAHVLDLMRARSIQQIPILDSSGFIVGLHSLREIIGRVERKNWAVVMAGGRGERLRPLTDAVPKPMVPVAGRPILEWLVLHLVGFGIRRMYISVNYLSHVIEDHFGDGSDFGCDIRYLRETQPLGTGGSLSLLTEVPSLPLLVMNGDLVTRFDVGELLAYHERSGSILTMGIHEYRHTVPFGVVDLEGDRVIRVREKPAEIWTTNAGIYVLDPAIVRRVAPDSVVQLPDLVEDAVVRGERVGVFRISGEWVDVGRPVELRRARGEERSS